MIELNNGNLEFVQKELKRLRKRKYIQVNNIAEKLDVKSPWASEMFSQLGTLNTNRFVELIGALDMKVYIDPQMNDHVSVDELGMDQWAFVVMVISQWKKHDIDGNQAMRKITNKLNLKIGDNE